MTFLRVLNDLQMYQHRDSLAEPWRPGPSRPIWLIAVASLAESVSCLKIFIGQSCDNRVIETIKEHLKNYILMF